MTWARTIKALLCVQAVVLCAYVVLLLAPVEARPGLLHDEVLNDVTRFLPALAVFLRGVRYPADRAWSWLIAAGIGSFAVGDVVFTSYVAHQDPEPFPSVADIGFLGLYPLVALGLLMLVRHDAGTVRRSMLLDGMTAFSVSRRWRARSRLP